MDLHFASSACPASPIVTGRVTMQIGVKNVMPQRQLCLECMIATPTRHVMIVYVSDHSPTDRQNKIHASTLY